MPAADRLAPTVGQPHRRSRRPHGQVTARRRQTTCCDSCARIRRRLAGSTPAPARNQTAIRRTRAPRGLARVDRARVGTEEVLARVEDHDDCADQRRCRHPEHPRHRLPPWALVAGRGGSAERGGGRSDAIAHHPLQQRSGTPRPERSTTSRLRLQSRHIVLRPARAQGLTAQPGRPPVRRVCSSMLGDSARGRRLVQTP